MVVRRQSPPRRDSFPVASDPTPHGQGDICRSCLITVCCRGNASNGLTRGAVRDGQSTSGLSECGQSWPTPTATGAASSVRRWKRSRRYFSLPRSHSVLDMPYLRHRSQEVRETPVNRRAAAGGACFRRSRATLTRPSRSICRCRLWFSTPYRAGGGNRSISPTDRPTAPIFCASGGMQHGGPRRC